MRAQPIAVATASGDVDFGVTAFTAGLYNLAGKGVLKVIGGMSREKAGFPLIGYFASNNAYAAGLKAPKDLAGKRIAVTQVGSSFHYSLGLLADKYGFKLSDVKVLPLQSLSQRRRRTEGRNRSECGVVADVDRAKADGRQWRQAVGLGRRRNAVWQLGAVFASGEEQLASTCCERAGDQRAARCVLERADREYHDVILAAVKDGNAPIDQKTKPLLEIIAKYTNLPVEQVVWAIAAPIDPDEKLSSMPRMPPTRSIGCRSRALSTRASMPIRSSPRVFCEGGLIVSVMAGLVQPSRLSQQEVSRGCPGQAGACLS